MEENGFRYILEKYSGPESRHVCPSCGYPGKFTRFVRSDTGEQLADHVGICSRINSCQYKCLPHEYFKEHPEARPKGMKHMQGLPAFTVRTAGPLDLSRNTIGRSAIKALYEAEAQEEEGRLASSKRWPYRALYGPENKDTRMKLLCHSAFRTSPGSSTLAGFLHDKLKDRQQALKEVLKDYKIGSWRFDTVFWYMDIDGRIRTGKVMRYRPDGHRDKEHQPWLIHGKLKQSGHLPESWTLRRCLFGEHLLTKYPSYTVGLVESEKTAIIAATFFKDQPVIWLAAGGLQYLNVDSCAGLKGRQVIAYPDLQAFDLWKNTLAGIAPHVGFSFTVFDTLERTATEEERQKGLDIADFLLKDNEL